MRGARDRDRGVTLVTLDLTSAERYAHEEAVKALKHEEYGVAAEDLKAKFGWDPYGYVKGPDGKEYVVCHEGVGWEVSADAPLDLPVYLSGGSRHGMFPAFEVRLSIEEVRKAATGAEVDLADHVRSFGARLETNFWSWYRLLTKEVAADVRGG